MTSGTTNVRRRSLDVKVNYGKVKDLTTPEVFSNGGSSSWSGVQYTESAGHRRGRDGRYHEGGPFFTYRIEPEIPTRNVTIDGTLFGRHYQYVGPIHVPNVPSTIAKAQLPLPDSSYLNPVGAEAISIVDPTNPNANFGVALGEIIKDRKLPIPILNSWKKRTDIARKAGSEYLNAVFGWLPLVSDMKDTAQSVLDGNTIIENYRSASGTLVHREFEFPTLESEVSNVVSTNVADTGPSGIPGTSISPVDITCVTKSSTRRWFSGSFTYYANGDHSSIGKCIGIGSDAEKLFGVSLTPDLVWELTPWSWAIDWFSNAGNVISNATSLGLAGLVMQYGYIMEETSIIKTYSMPTTGFNQLNGTVPPAKIVYNTKRRVEANPFGFGLTWDGLSPTQLAITAALGITRLR